MQHTLQRFKKIKLSYFKGFIKVEWNNFIKKIK